MAEVSKHAVDDGGFRIALSGTERDCGRAQKWRCVACGHSISPGTEALGMVNETSAPDDWFPVLVHADCLVGLRLIPDLLEFRSTRLSGEDGECDQDAARKAITGAIHRWFPASRIPKLESCPAEITRLQPEPEIEFEPEPEPVVVPELETVPEPVVVPEGEGDYKITTSLEAL